jgi:serine/threonine-protein kinase RsbW
MNAVLGLRGVDVEFRRLVEFAEEFARRCHLPDPERARLLIILEELFTNAVRHGYPDGAQEGRIEVALAAKPGHIEIAFSDDGEPFDPLTQVSPDFGQPPAERPAGGLGLHILRSLVDEARYRREAGRNHLALVRNLARSD